VWTAVRPSAAHARRPQLADAARFARHRVGDRWHVDETYVRVAGRWVYLYRAVDQFGQVIDVSASTRRDTEAARRFFRRARTTAGVAPVEVVTDQAPTYPRVLDEMVPAAWHDVRSMLDLDAHHGQPRPSPHQPNYTLPGPHPHHCYAGTTGEAPTRSLTQGALS
jgi:transposase-like protein